MEFFYESTDGTEKGTFVGAEAEFAEFKATGFVEITALRLPTQTEIDASFAPQLDRFEEIANILGIVPFDRAAALVKLKAKSNS